MSNYRFFSVKFDDDLMMRQQRFPCLQEETHNTTTPQHQRKIQSLNLQIFKARIKYMKVDNEVTNEYTRKQKLRKRVRSKRLNRN